MLTLTLWIPSQSVWTQTLARMTSSGTSNKLTKLHDLFFLCNRLQKVMVPGLKHGAMWLKHLECHLAYMVSFNSMLVIFICDINFLLSDRISI